MSWSTTTPKGGSARIRPTDSHIRSHNVRREKNSTIQKSARELLDVMGPALDYVAREGGNTTRLIGTLRGLANGSIHTLSEDAHKDLEIVARATMDCVDIHDELNQLKADIAGMTELQAKTAMNVFLRKQGPFKSADEMLAVIGPVTASHKVFLEKLTAAYASGMFEPSRNHTTQR